MDHEALSSVVLILNLWCLKKESSGRHTKLTAWHVSFKHEWYPVLRTMVTSLDVHIGELFPHKFIKIIYSSLSVIRTVWEGGGPIAQESGFLRGKLHGIGNVQKNSYMMLKCNSLEPALSSTWWRWRGQLLLLSCHCNSGIREKERRDTKRDHILTVEELKTSWLFLLYPCCQSQSTNCLRYLVNDNLGGVL